MTIDSGRIRPRWLPSSRHRIWHSSTHFDVIVLLRSSVSGNDKFQGDLVVIFPPPKKTNNNKNRHSFFGHFGETFGLDGLDGPRRSAERPKSWRLCIWRSARTSGVRRPKFLTSRLSLFGVAIFGQLEFGLGCVLRFCFWGWKWSKLEIQILQA